jgi:signal transduction histidine kinase
MRLVYTKVLLLLSICLLLNSVAAASGEVYQISLEGSHKFSEGDDLLWASPDFDDSLWRSIRVPGSWQSQGLEVKGGIGWYRIRFEATEETTRRQPAIALGLIGNADEVFLNGEKVGGEGLIASQYVIAPIERLYRLPDHLLKVGKENLLAVRVLNVYYDGGIVEGPVAVGDFSQLIESKLTREKKTTALEAGFISFFAFAFIYPFFLYSRAASERESLFASLCLLLIWADITLGSRIFYTAGLRTFFAERILAIIAALQPACFLMFLMHWYQERMTTAIKALLALCLLLALSLAVLPGIEQFLIIADVMTLAYIPIAVLVLFLSIRAYLRKMHEAGPILIGMVGMVAGVIIELAGPSNFQRIQGILVSYYAIGWLATFLMYARAARFSRIQKSLRTVSEKVLIAHEEERKRLARDLHDGLGQSMMAIKLNLQMINARTQTGEPITQGWLPKLISEVSNSIEELRQVAAGLRPSFLEDVEIGDAFNWYGKQFQDKSGIEVRVDAADSLPASPRVKEHLFRIYQEALSNIGKHAGSRMVDVSLRTIGQRLCLSIKDDGKGFEVSEAIDNKQGLGLSTIRERAELLGGVFDLKSAPGKGTTIRVEVPLND